MGWSIEQIAPATSDVYANSSTIAILSNQALKAWDSLALWVGAAAVFGHMAPLWSRFRGGTGIPPAMALTVWFAPFVFVATVAGFLGAQAMRYGRQPSIIVGFAVGLGWSWVGWAWELGTSWGVPYGPELTLWCGILAALMTPRVANASEYANP